MDDLYTQGMKLMRRKLATINIVVGQHGEHSIEVVEEPAPETKYTHHKTGADMIYSHDGDLGDTIAAMAVMRELGGGDLVLFPTNTREKYSPARVSIIAPLLEKQHYITGVKYADGPATGDGINLGGWRFNYKNGLNLCDMYFSWIHKPHPDRDQPWLWVYEPEHVADVVFCRSSRYHGCFPWKRAVAKYKGRSVFVGLKDEHESFCNEFGDIPHHPTADLYESARVIQGAKLVLVNQTSLFWIAEGLKRPLCLEVAGGPKWAAWRNCHFDRTGSIYGENQLMELPDLDILDERLAYVCAERDQDRSCLSMDKRLGLARAALSVAGLDGEVAELGTYKGGGAAIIAAAIPDKTVHLFDTFTGIPSDDVLPGGHREGDFATDLEEVKRFLRGYRVEFHQGLFPDTTKGREDQRFSFVHLDGDLYQTTAAGLDYFWPRMVPGGKIVLDDVGWGACPGVVKALEERELKPEMTANFQGVLTK